LIGRLCGIDSQVIETRTHSRITQVLIPLFRTGMTTRSCCRTQKVEAHKGQISLQAASMKRIELSWKRL
jgi:hypothetical protein